MIGILISFLPFIIYVGLIFLQIRLSKRLGKWPGLVVPALLLCSSLASGLKAFANSDAAGWQAVAAGLASFFSSNVFTLVLLVIYFVQREKIKRRAQLDKMNVQDLD